jgi:glycosyltransferase involved in cell wall biosynthesis
MIILIPAYEPDRQLAALIRSIQSAEPRATLVVVDDGSGPDYREVFDDAARLGCHIVGYARNRGKGYALRAGFRFIEGHFPGQDVVCADSDGQHRAEDILRVARTVDAASAAMVLGSRNFTGNVPARSRFGNTATRWLFRLATGERISDTQTGLRGYPSSMLPWLLTVRGDRYEYELNLLLEASQAGLAIRSVEIATVYLDHNSGSHFRPMADSVRIYAPLLKFLASSLTSFAIDTAAFLILEAATDSLLAAVVGARILSSTANFLINRRLVFEHGRDKPAGAAGARYFALVAVLLGANYALISALATAAVPSLPAKILAEIALLAVSYAVQQRVLFARKAPETGPETGPEAAASATHMPGYVPAQFRHSLPVDREEQPTNRLRRIP